MIKFNLETYDTHIPLFFYFTPFMTFYSMQTIFIYNL